jgi:hypothetical protein
MNARRHASDPRRCRPRAAPGWLALLCLLASSACKPSPALSVRVHLPEQLQFALEQVSFSPSGHVASMRHDRSGLLQLETDGTALVMHIPDLCPLRIPRRSGSATQLELKGKRMLATAPVLAQVGYDASFSIVVVAGCPEAAQGTIHWRQAEGPPLPTLTPSARGQRLDARTLPRASFFPEGLPPGVVPISPRTQGRYVLEATPKGQALPVRPFTVTVTSVARATGLPSVAVSQRVLLGGAGWRAARLAPGSQARVEELAGASSFQPDVPGRFELVDGAGQRLELQALTHDLTPLDCGRSECHAAIASAAAQSPMSHAFELPFAHGLAKPSQHGCMLDCHVVGEPGLRDGGYRALAAELPFQPNAHVPFAELPHALQRVAGVRCTSCHGPGAVPPHEGRARILQSGVCATCHDAPPAYAQVEQWSASRMARSDARPETRAPGCAQCHTTEGFLQHNQLRAAPPAPHAQEAVVGIACAACHAPHGQHAGQALVRKLAAAPRLGATAALADTSSAVCTPCHSPLADQLVPSASSAALWLGRLELPEPLGEDLRATRAAHAALPGGCMGCHGRRASAPRKTDHSFKVERALCAECHADAARASWDEGKRALMARSRALQEALAQACGFDTHAQAGVPAHAGREPRACRSPALARAAYLLRLVVEDGAAFEHNGAFATELLDQVATALRRQ